MYIFLCLWGGWAGDLRVFFCVCDLILDAFSTGRGQRYYQCKLPLPLPSDFDHKQNGFMLLKVLFGLLTCIKRDVKLCEDSQQGIKRIKYGCCV